MVLATTNSVTMLPNSNDFQRQRILPHFKAQKTVNELISQLFGVQYYHWVDRDELCTKANRNKNIVLNCVTILDQWYGEFSSHTYGMHIIH